MAKQKLCMVYGEYHKFTYQTLTGQDQFLQACECGHMTLCGLSRASQQALEDGGFGTATSPQIETGAGHLITKP